MTDERIAKVLVLVLGRDRNGREGKCGELRVQWQAMGPS